MIDDEGMERALGRLRDNLEELGAEARKLGFRYGDLLEDWETAYDREREEREREDRHRQEAEREAAEGDEPRDGEDFERVEAGHADTPSLLERLDATRPADWDEVVRHG